jgi:hypothetical protein
MDNKTTFIETLESVKNKFIALYSITQNDLNLWFTDIKLYDGVNLAQHLSSKLICESGTVYFINRLDPGNKSFVLAQFGLNKNNLKQHYFFMWYCATDPSLESYYNKTLSEKTTIMTRYFEYLNK